MIPDRGVEPDGSASGPMKQRIVVRSLSLSDDGQTRSLNRGKEKKIKFRNVNCVRKNLLYLIVAYSSNPNAIC